MTDQQTVFAAEYAHNGRIGSAAYRMAYGCDNAKLAAKGAYKLLQKPQVREAVERMAGRIAPLTATPEVKASTFDFEEADREVMAELFAMSRAKDLSLRERLNAHKLYVQMRKCLKESPSGESSISAELDAFIREMERERRGTGGYRSPVQSIPS